ncbi:MAG: FeoA domain-containing protein [Micropruina glycogenica]
MRQRPRCGRLGLTGRKVLSVRPRTRRSVLRVGITYSCEIEAPDDRPHARGRSAGNPRDRRARTLALARQLSRMGLRQGTSFEVVRRSSGGGRVAVASRVALGGSVLRAVAVEVAP